MSHAGAGELSVIIAFVEKLKDDKDVKGFCLDQCVNFSHELSLKTGQDMQLEGQAKILGVGLFVLHGLLQ